jgi:hypothetical protein
MGLAVNVTFVPAQIVVVVLLILTDGVSTAPGDTVIPCPGELPHSFLANTVIFPALFPSITIMELVPFPATTDQPGGVSHV